MNHDTLIGETHFVDGVTRKVYQDSDGRQFVYDGNERVYGVWIHPDKVPDHPFVVVKPDTETTQESN